MPPPRPDPAADLRRTTASLRRIARAVVGEAEADDVVQDTWLSLVDGRLPARPSRSFLAGVTRHLALRRRRGNDRRRDRERVRAGEARDPATGADALAIRYESAARLAHALAALPADQRLVISLRYDDGLPSAEIARRLGIPAGTVRARLKRGLDRLRAALSEDENEDSWSGAFLAWAASGPGRTAAIGATTMAMTTKTVAGVCAALLIGLSGWLVLREDAPPFEPDLRDPRIERPTADLQLDRGDAAAARTTAGDSPTEVLAQPATEPLTIRLVSATDGAPLEDYAVELVDERGASVAAVSDTDGVLDLEDGLEPGEWTLRALDHLRLAEVNEHSETPVQVRSVELDEERSASIELDVGPTYAWSGRLPLPAASLVAKLEPMGRSPVIGHAYAPVREGARPWVRFSSSAPFIAGQGPWRLTVQSDDGFWSGHTIVEDISAGARLDVELEVLACGRVEGTLVTTAGPLVGIQNWVQLFDPVTDAWVAAAHLERDSGAFSLAHLPPGSLRLEFTDARLEALVASVDVVAGETVEPRIAVRLRDDLGSIEGVLVADEPLTVERAWLGARELEDPSPFPRYRQLVSAAELVRELPFTFENLPPGEYEIMLEADTLALGREVVLPVGTRAARLPIVAVTPVERVVLELLVVDDETGAPIPHPRFHGRHPEESWSFDGAFDGTLELHGQPTPFDYTISARGYRPRWGAGSELEDGGEVRLEAGWGAEFRVFDDGNDAVEGLELRLDGSSVGVTDAEGRLRVVLPYRPARLELGDAAWRIVGGNADPETGALDEQSWGVWVSVRRVE